MLSFSNPPSPTSEDEANSFETIIAAIKAPLSDLYRENFKLELEAELNDDQFQQLETALEETLAAWRSKINFNDYAQNCLKIFKADCDKEIAQLKFYLQLCNQAEIEELASNESENTDEKFDNTPADEKELTVAEVQAAYDLQQELKKQYYGEDHDEDEEKNINITLMLEKHFNELTPSWYIGINIPYNNDGFNKFITAIISKKVCHFLRANCALSEKAVDKILITCKGLPADSISIAFSEDQDITDYQARKILEALPSIRYHIEFTEKENLISESTAKKLAYSEFTNKLMVSGYGTYHNISKHVRLIKTADIRNIFYDGADCSIEDIEQLIKSLKEDTYSHSFDIRKGNYTTPAWEYFFTTILQEKDFKLYTFELGRLIEGPFAVSDAVLSAIFTALQTNKTVWRLELRRLTLTPDSMTSLINALAVNDCLQEIILNNVTFPETTFGNLLSSLNTNPRSKVSTLNLNYSHILDSYAESFRSFLTHNTSLRKLFLGSTYINNATCKAIGDALKTNRTLFQLSIFENGLTDKALMDLTEGLLENNTLRELHMLQLTNFSIAAINAFLIFRKYHYSTEFTVGLYTDENLQYCEELTLRNKNIRTTKQLKIMNAYTWMAVILFRAELKNKFTGIPLTGKIIELILSYFFPNGEEPLQHRDLIKENMLNGGWRTTVTVPVRNNPFSPIPTTREKVLYERWARPGLQLKIDDAIQYLKSSTPTNIDFISGQYIDYDKASKLGAALQTNTWLTQLNLAMCHLDDTEFEFIAVGLLNREKPLTVLNLDRNNLTARSFARMRQLIANGKVKQLMIFNNKGLSDVPRIVDELKIIADTCNAKIHCEAPIKRAPRNGFFIPNPARIVIEVADEKKEREAPRLGSRSTL